MSSWSAAPSSLGPGSTSFAPAIGPAKISDHALAWYIGTTGITVSRLDSASAAPAQFIMAHSTVERCE
jgi:hypothetical protein